MIKHAVLVGINQYGPESGLTDLKYAEADASDLAKVLEGKYGFRTKPLLGKEASRDALEQSLLSCGEGELFLFFFAGHGQLIRGQYRLHPADSYRSGFRTLSLDDLGGFWRHGFGYEKVLAILDACRHEMGGARGENGFDTQSARRVHTLIEAERWVEILYGCSEGQVSYEDDELGHGLLTHALLQVLRRDHERLSAGILAGAAGDTMRDWCEEDQLGRRQEVVRHARSSLTQGIELLSGDAPPPAATRPRPKKKRKKAKGGAIAKEHGNLPPRAGFAGLRDACSVAYAKLQLELLLLAEAIISGWFEFAGGGEGNLSIEWPTRGVSREKVADFVVDTLVADPRSIHEELEWVRSAPAELRDVVAKRVLHFDRELFLAGDQPWGLVREDSFWAPERPRIVGLDPQHTVRGEIFRWLLNAVIGSQFVAAMRAFAAKWTADIELASRDSFHEYLVAAYPNYVTNGKEDEKGWNKWTSSLKKLKLFAFLERLGFVTPALLTDGPGYVSDHLRLDHPLLYQALKADFREPGRLSTHWDEFFLY